MPNLCPLCGQPLPKAFDDEKLHAKLDKLTAAATQLERRKLENEFTDRLSAERENARVKAKMEFEKRITKLHVDKDRQIRAARESAIAETIKKNALEVAKARKEASDEARREIRFVTQHARMESEKKLSTLQLVREKEQVRHSSEIAKLQGKLEDFSRKLEKQTGEQLGEEGEIDLYSALRKEFVTDRIERVGRGVKGADILLRIMDGGREAGCIVYECKNVTTWQKAYIAQAKKYHTQYDTPYVMIVSRAFPKKLRGMCVMNDVPIVEPRFAIALTSMMREGIIEIAKLRLTKVGANEKAQELFVYVTGNEFQTRFRDMSETVDGLMDFLRTEKNWHENHWAKESDLHARIQKRHREIDARVRVIVKGTEKLRPIAVADGRRRA
jgi:hypothetical protein